MREKRRLPVIDGWQASRPDGLVKEVGVLRKGKEPKRKSIALTLMRDIQGSAADKLAMFQKVRAAGGFAKEDPAELEEAEKALRAFAAIEKESG